MAFYIRAKRIVLNSHGKFCAEVEDRLLSTKFVKTAVICKCTPRGLDILALPVLK